MPPSDHRHAFLAARFLLVLLCTLGPVTLGFAQTEPDNAAADRPLTGRGRFLLSGTLGGSWSHDSETRLGTLTRWRVSATPSVTYFVRDYVGAGLHLGGGVARGAAGNAYRQLIERRAENVLVGVHGALDVPIARRLSLLLWPALAYVHEWSRDTLDTDGAGATFQQQATLATPVRRYELGYVRCALSAMLLFHLSSRVGIGFGPDLWLDFIVRRVPDYGPQYEQRPLYPGDDSPTVSELVLEGPARRRFQVGLSTFLVVAL